MDGSARRLSSLEESAALAREALQRAPAGSLLLLTGPLGAGKTTFTRLLGEALGSSAAITSPTYTLVHEYPTPEGPLIHIDAYRLPDPTALTGLGLDDYLDRARLVVVEWGLPLKSVYPDALVLEFTLHTSGGAVQEDGHDPTQEAGHAGAEFSVERTARWLTEEQP